MNDDEHEAIVCRIRPASWKICVQGQEEVEHVRQVLQAYGAECTPVREEPDSLNLPIFAFMMTPKGQATVPPLELQTLSEQDERIEMAWEECRPCDHSVIF